MNHQYPQSNPGTYVSSLRCETLDAARVGSTDTAILRFGSIGTPAGTGLAVTDSAANGTVVEIQRPGLYACKLRSGAAGTVPTALAISLNTDAAGLNAVPSLSLSGQEDFLQVEGAVPPFNLAGVAMTCLVAVTQADIDAGVTAGATGAQVRFHGRLTSDVDATNLSDANSSMTVQRVASLF